MAARASRVLPVEPAPHLDRMTLCLGNCPYRDAARESQAVICTLHRGITLGLLDVLDPHAKLTDFVPRDLDFMGRRRAAD